jgi:phosphatidate cytidylyltransferase
MKDILLRSATGAVFVAVVLGSLWSGGWLSFAVMGFIGAIGLHEFYTLKKNPMFGPTRWLSIVLGMTAYFIYTAMYFELLDPFFIPHVALLPLLTIFIVEIYRNKAQPLENTSLSFFGWVYILMPLYLLAFLANHAFLYALAPLLLIWTNDSFAYLGGRFLGKKSLFPRISPKKTWEGTIIGVLFTVVVGLIISLNTGSATLFWMISAILVAIASILGDLFESLFKRSLNIKDSGKLLPGHGGILDRFDATLFAVPLFYILLTTAQHWGWINIEW